MIQEAASAALEKDEKTQKKHIKKLSKSISELKWETVSDFTKEFETIKKFESHCKHAKKVSEDVNENMKTIEAAVNNALAGEQWDDLIVIDDAQVDKDMYIQIVFKFYSAMRHDLYTKIQQYWKTNQDELMVEFNKKKVLKKEPLPGTQDLDNPSSDEEENPIDDETILKLAQEIDSDKIYQQVFALYGVSWKYDIQLSIKKMEHVFLQDETNIHYLECLTEAHNQMLYQIQDPFNNYDIMKTNPLDNKEAMHGVPKDFGDILLEITRYENQPDVESVSDVMSVEMKKDSFVEFDDTTSQQSDFFTR